MLFQVLVAVCLVYIAWILLTDSDQKVTPTCERADVTWGAPRVSIAEKYYSLAEPIPDTTAKSFEVVNHTAPNIVQAAPSSGLGTEKILVAENTRTSSNVDISLSTSPTFGSYSLQVSPHAGTLLEASSEIPSTEGCPIG